MTIFKAAYCHRVKADLSDQLGSGLPIGSTKSHLLGHGKLNTRPPPPTDPLLLLFPVSFSALEYSLDVDKLNLSAIRTVRVLRPLRAINRIPSEWMGIKSAPEEEERYIVFLC